MEKVKNTFKNFMYDTGLLIVGCFLLSLSFVLFFDTHSIAPGGLTGLAVIINYLFGIPLWIINYFLIYLYLLLLIRF